MAISLQNQSGLPIAFGPENSTLNFSDDIIVGAVNHRTFAEMQKFIREPAARPSRDPIYTVWRQVNRTNDAKEIVKAGLRYDLTLIPPGKFIDKSQEFFRTAGHYHKPVRPEIYEVLYGRAYLIIQRPARPVTTGRPRPEAGGNGARGDFSKLEEIYVMEAGPGEKALIPPGFGHVSVNPFTEPLLLANWIAEAETYDYEPFAQYRGAGYWVMQGPDQESIEFEKNNNYSAVPELKKLRPKEIAELGLIKSAPLYALTWDIVKLDFLKTPEKYQRLLTLDHCYRPVI